MQTRTRFIRSLVAASITVIVAGCSGDTEPSAADEASESPSVSASADATPGKSPAPQEVGDSPALSGSAACDDKRGDGKGGDLTSVSLESDGTDLIATFETTKPIPSSGTALFVIDAWNAAGDTGYQLGVKYDGGDQIAHFVFDHVAANQVNLDGEASTDGTTTKATFPVSEIESLGKSFDWTAAYNVAGNDVDECPKSSGDIMKPNQETFPS